MHISPYSIELNTFKIWMRKCINITYTTVYPNSLFSFRYQNQAIKRMILLTVWMLFLDRFTWVDEPLNKTCKTPLLKNHLAWC